MVCIGIFFMNHHYVRCKLLTNVEYVFQQQEQWGRVANHSGWRRTKNLCCLIFVSIINDRPWEANFVFSNNGCLARWITTWQLIGEEKRSSSTELGFTAFFWVPGCLFKSDVIWMCYASRWEKSVEFDELQYLDWQLSTHPHFMNV